MTTYDYTAAGLRAPTTFTRRLVSNTAFFQSTMTGVIQTVSRPGEHWVLDVGWENLNSAQFSNLIAFFTRLNGREHRVQFANFGHTQRGAYGGTPLVNGGSQTGNSLVIDGASTGVTDWAKSGDIISYDNQFRMVTADANSDGSGNVTLSIIPAIRTSPANNAVVNVTGAETGTFILLNEVELMADARRYTNGGDYIGSVALQFIEDLSA